MASGSSPKRWSNAERARWQKVLDEARSSAEWRRAFADSAGSSEVMAGTANRATTTGGGLHEDLALNSTPARKRKSAWTPEERSRLQAALDGVRGRPLELTPVSGADAPVLPAKATGDRDTLSSPLDGRPWTDEQRTKVEAALAELKAVRLAAAALRRPIVLGPTVQNRQTEKSVACALSERLEEHGSVLTSAGEARLHEVSDAAGASGEPELQADSFSTKADVLLSAPDEPVGVERADSPGLSVEFTLPAAPAEKSPSLRRPSCTVDDHPQSSAALAVETTPSQPSGQPAHSSVAYTTGRTNWHEVRDAWAQPGESGQKFSSFAHEAKLLELVPHEPVVVEQAESPSSSQEFKLPRAPSQEGPCWYGPNQPVEVFGLRLPGLIRVATTPQSRWQGLHPATIAAWMPVDLNVVADQVEPLEDIWATPSFGSLTAAERGLYLSWIASGRTFDVPARFALLFLLGLESRVLELGAAHLADEERREMVLVARDLVERYGAAHRRLRERGCNFADFLEVVEVVPRLYLSKAPEFPESLEFPAQLQVAIGQAAKDGETLPPDWALASVLCDLRVPKRTAVLRCPEELKELFCILFRSKFPSGLALRRWSESTLQVAYRGMTDPTTGESACTVLNVPTALQASLLDSQKAELRKLLDQCTDELSIYSRFLGRSPSARASPDADERLPLPLLQQRLKEQLRTLGEEAAGTRKVSLEQTWITLWGRQAERKDSEPFLRDLLKREGLTVDMSAPKSKSPVSSPTAAIQAFRLDPERLQKVRKDDAESTKLLAALFADSDSQTVNAHRPELHGHEARALLPMLDDDHYRFLTTLLEEDAWNREQLQAAARQVGLMLDGALEVINDAAFDLAGVVLVTDDGQLEVDPAAAEELRTALANPGQRSG